MGFQDLLAAEFDVFKKYDIRRQGGGRSNSQLFPSIILVTAKTTAKSLVWLGLANHF
jgi:hypothetical protein